MYPFRFAETRGVRTSFPSREKMSGGTGTGNLVRMHAVSRTRAAVSPYRNNPVTNPFKLHSIGHLEQGVFTQ